MNSTPTRRVRTRPGALALLALIPVLAALTAFAARPTAELSPRFNHVMLFVSDLEASIEFYTTAFDLEVTQRLDALERVQPDGSVAVSPVRMAFLKFPGQEFVLELSEQAITVEGPGRFYQHLGIDVVDIEAAADRVQEAGARNFSGIREVRAPDAARVLNAFFVGPDGEQLELMQLLEGEF